MARIGLIAAVLVAYSPLFSADFSNWDDTYNIADNPRLNPPTCHSVAFFWTHSAFDLYTPITYSVWAVLAKAGYVAVPDASGWHLNPYVYHAANIFVHLVSALLVFSILQKIVDQSVAAAWIGAMIFALHPVQVETVGWISGMKDLLAGMFALAALRLYLEDGPPARQRICFTLAIPALVLAMLCKPIAMVLPVMAMAIDLALHHRSLRRIAVRFACWIPLTIVCAAIAAHAQPEKFPESIVSPIWRPLIAGDALAFYLWKIVWPIHLGIDYGRTPRAVLAGGKEFFTCLVPLALLILLWIKRREWKIPAAGACVFVISLAPVLGLVPFDFQLYSTVADHYLYLPMLGIAMVVAFVIVRWPKRWTFALASAAILLLSVQTFLQSRVWQNSISLFSHALHVNPQSWAAHQNLSLAKFNDGDLAGAEQQVRLALKIKPNYGDAYMNLSNILRMRGDMPDAIAAATRATEALPKNPECWIALGHAQSAAHHLPAAIATYRCAAALAPTDPKILINLASAEAEAGNLQEAIKLYDAILQINPASAEVRQGRSQAMDELNRRGRPPATQVDH